MADRLRIHRPHRPVDPSEAQRLPHRLVVSDERVGDAAAGAQHEDAGRDRVVQLEPGPPLGRVGEGEALAVIEKTLAEHNPAAVGAMRRATRWTRGQTLAEVVFQYASPAVQSEVGRRLAALSTARDEAQSSVV